MRPFRLTGSLDGRSPLILASPHSGSWLPADFLAAARLPAPTLRRIEDAHVGELLAQAAKTAPLLEAVVSRALIDLNRAEDELDPAMFAGNVVQTPRITERVRHGYGLFPRLVGPNLPIHGAHLPAALGAARIAALHRPWHDTLARGLAAARARHGYAVLLDMHSMPRLDGARPARVVLGDRMGLSAAPVLVDWLEQHFRDAGLTTRRNTPYAGGHTTERHGKPEEGLHAVQLELDRSLYMEQATLKPHDGFAGLAELLAELVDALILALPGMGLAPGLPLAAE